MHTPSLSRPTTYDARCLYCARQVFRAARRLGGVQLDMIENHVLACRPLEPIERTTDLLVHFKITETAA
ncbi:MAG TPA: hypothetical protein VGK30_21080 [Candidatus Binatia bacterium]